MKNNIYIMLDMDKGAAERLINFIINYKINVLTYDKDIYQICKTKNINVVLLSLGVLKFKYQINKLKIGLLILRDDNIHPRNNYLARKFKSIVILLSITTGECQLLRDIYIQKNNSILFRIYKKMGFVRSVCGVRFSSYEINITCFIKLIYFKIVYNHKMENAPGLVADKLLVSSESAKKFYLGNGVGSNKIQVTGVFQDDEISLIAHKNLNQCLPNSEKYDILIISDPGFEVKHLNIYDQFRQVVESFPHLKIAIKLHPREKLEHHTYAKEFDNVRIFEYIGSIERDIKLVNSSSVILGVHSSFLFYCLILNKPVIFYDLKNTNMSEVFTSRGAPLQVKSINEMRETYESLSSDMDFVKNSIKLQQLMLKKFGFFDRNCHKRIYQEIKNLGL